MNYYLYGLKYIIDYKVLRKRIPLICGMTITNECNLKCRQCRVAERGKKKLSFEEIMIAMQSFYYKGGRTIYFQGGEPFIWKDRSKTLEDLILLSREIGFLTSIIYTNGTLPITTSANTVFVSLDGLTETHDYLRGKTFEKIINNLRNSDHPSIFINSVINNYNKNELPKFCEYIDGIKQIRGVFFYFHTPYYGIDDLYIHHEERNEIMQSMIKMKKRYKILNSKAGLESAIRNDWKRPLDICQVYEKGEIYKCCRTPNDPELCKNCGYLSYAEIDQTLRLKPSAIINAIKYF